MSIYPSGTTQLNHKSCNSGCYLIHDPKHLNGQLLGGLLLHLRGQEESTSPEPDPMPEAEEQQEQPNNPGD